MASGAASRAIDGFPKDITYQKVEEIVSPLLKAAEELDGPHQETENVTPLMVACDKGQIETVRFLLKYRRRSERASSLVGRIRRKCTDSGNTVIHYAAMSGEKEILKQLFEVEREETNNHANKEASFQFLHTMLNYHNDTPLMMAAGHGRLDLLEYWIPLVDEKRTALSKRNNTDDSALSLASVGGHQNVFDLLLESSSIDVEYSDLRSAENAYAKVGDFYDKNFHRANAETIDNIEMNLAGISHCRNILREMLQKKADEVASNLDIQLSSAPVKKKTTNKKSKTKKKRKGNNAKKKRSQVLETSSCYDNQFPVLKEEHSVDPVQSLSQEQPPEEDLSNSEGSSKSSVSEDVEGKENDLTTTDHDDTRTQKPADLHQENKEEGSLSPLVLKFFSIPSHKSAEDLFQDEFLEGDEKIKDLMEALCIDVSHLVLSSPKMAFNLSACQLDAVEAILEHQKTAVQEARAIQKQLLVPETRRKDETKE